MKATPITPQDIHNHQHRLIAYMRQCFRPASYLTEQDDRGDLRAAGQFVSFGKG